MKKIILLISVFFVLGCNVFEDKKKSALESALKNTIGVDTDIESIKNSEDNKVEIDIQDNVLNLNERFRNGFGTATATKEGLALTVTNGEDHILVGFTGTDLTQTRPIKGKVNGDGDNSMSFSTADYNNGGMDLLTSFDMEAEIVSLNRDRIIIKLKGSIGYGGDAKITNKWKYIEGTITLNHPVFQAIGSAKEDFFY